MKNYFYIILLIVLTGCTREHIYQSPDKKLTLKCDSQSGLLHIKVIDNHQNIILSKETDVSTYHKWNVQWISNNKFLLKSSDIGDYYWEYVNKSWTKVPANRTTTNSKYVVDAIWNSYRNKTVILEVGIPDGDSTDIILRLPTAIPVKDIAGCISCKDDIISLQGVDGVHKWKLQNDGHLVEIENTNPNPQTP